MRCGLQRAGAAVVAAVVAAVLPALVAAAVPAEAKRRRVAAPKFVRTIPTGETGWFSSPGLVNLRGDRRLEVVAPFYSTFVFSARGRLLGKGTATSGRVYAPGVVADLDRDGRREIGRGQRGDGGGVQPPERRPAGQAGLAGLDL